MKKEIIVVTIGVIGLVLAGSDASPDVWPMNVLLGALCLLLAGILAIAGQK